MFCKAHIVATSMLGVVNRSPKPREVILRKGEAGTPGAGAMICVPGA